MKKTLEINPEVYYELVDAIVPHALFEGLEDAVDNIQMLQAKDELAKHQQEDLNAYLLYVPALVKVLEWHTTPSEHKRIKEMVSCLKY